MRFSVECAFPHLRKRGAGSRKSAFCNRRLTEKRTLHSPLDRGETKNRTLAQQPHGKAHSATRASRKSALCPGASPKTALCARITPSTWHRAALASLIAKGVVLKAPVLVDAIAVDLVLGYAYAARVEDRDARVRMPIGVRLEHPLVRVSVHKGCPRR